MTRPAAAKRVVSAVQLVSPGVIPHQQGKIHSSSVSNFSCTNSVVRLGILVGDGVAEGFSTSKSVGVRVGEGVGRFVLRAV